MEVEALVQPDVEEVTGFAADDLDDQPVDGDDTGVDEATGAEDFDVEGTVRELATRFDGLDASTVRAALGRISNFQSSLDRMQNQVGGIARMEEWRTQIEEDISALMDALSGDGLLEDEHRTRLSGRRAQRSKNAEREELLKELLDKVQPQSQNTLPPEWVKAQERVLTYARSKGLTDAQLAALPWAAAQETGDPFDAYDHLKRAIDTPAEDAEDGTAQRVGAKKAAAGKGAPPRQGANRGIEELINVYGTGGTLTDAERKSLAEYLGIQV